jgi:hypothetical protein
LIYAHFWFTELKSNSNFGDWKGFDPKYEQILNSLDLIEKTNEKWDERKWGNHYNLTEKWKYFLKKATLEDK